MCGQVIAVVVTSEEAANLFSRQVYLAIDAVRQECAYDFGDFVDHLTGFVAVVHSDWIFNCISNYSFVNPLSPSQFRYELDRSDAWRAVAA